MKTLFILTFLYFSSLTLFSQVYHGSIEVTGTTSTDTEINLVSANDPGISFPPTGSANFGDYALTLTGDVGVNEGVLITSISANGSSATVAERPTSSAADGVFAANQFSISVHKAQAGDNLETNSNVAFAWFSKTEWLCGTMRNSGDDGQANGLIASSDIGLVEEFTDPPGTDGEYTLNLAASPHSASSQDGILLVNGAKNEDNYALSRANADGSFTIHCHDNDSNGNVHENDPVNFVYLGISDLGKSGLLVLGRIQDNAEAQVTAGDYTVIKLAAGQWSLSIPGQDPSTGTLLLSAEGGGTVNVDNIVSYQWDSANNYWIIESRDLPNGSLQSGSATEPMFSFAFFDKTIIVTTKDDEDSGPGSLASLDDISLREAIVHSVPQTVIRFAPSLNGETIILNGSELLIDKHLAIDASGLPNGITISGNNATRIFTIPSGQIVNLNRLTLTGGNGAGATASGNGGAIYNASSSLTLINCSFQRNSASFGGGIYNYNNSSLSLNNCSFQGNSATSGGGISNSFSSPTLNNCSFQGNSATNFGGGISNSSSSLPSLTNCSFQGNSASSGGGIRNYYTSPSLTNCIIWNNKDNSGIGTAASSVSNSFSTPTYSHCLIQGLSKTNLDATGTSPNTNLAPTDPLFVLEVDPTTAPNTTGGKLLLRPGSPAIDAGDDTKNTTTTDLAGGPRISGTIDLGAYEMSALILSPVTIATSGNTGWAKPGDTVTLTFTANEPIQAPEVTMCGNTATVTNVSGNIWTASVIVNGGTTEGVATFSISATDLKGSIAAPVTTTTDGTAVTVDKTQPILTAPGDKMVDVSGPSGAVVSFSVGTSDNLDPAPVLVANPPSGSLFPIGETTVNLSLTDAAGNASVGNFKVTVRLLSAGDDTDGDGLNDLAEFQLSALGYNWQVSQPELVNTLMTNANTAGLFTTGQVETLHSGTPLISRNPATGKFKLTMDWKKSTNLTDFLDFPAPVGSAISINPQGDVEFEFPSAGNAAFFRIELE